MVVPPKYFFHAINVQQLIYVLYNFDEIALSHMVKAIQAIFVFYHYWQKFENSKWLPFLGRGKFFENWQ